MFTTRNLRFPLLPVAALLLTSSFSKAQDTVPPRPQITGVSHVGYFVSDLPKTIAFWHDLLGVDEYTTRPASPLSRSTTVSTSNCLPTRPPRPPA